jgi:hypothetical protein
MIAAVFSFLLRISASTLAQFVRRQVPWLSQGLQPASKPARAPIKIVFWKIFT